MESCGEQETRQKLMHVCLRPTYGTRGRRRLSTQAVNSQESYQSKNAARGYKDRPKMTGFCMAAVSESKCEPVSVLPACAVFVTRHRSILSITGWMRANAPDQGTDTI